jgi:hypothetical protein
MLATDLSIEQRVRLIWQLYKEYKSKRKIAKSQRLFEGGRDAPMSLIVQEVGLKIANYYCAEKVVNLADELMRRGKVQEANCILFILNNKSVNAAKCEDDRLLSILDQM